jgi:hypothetical protein
MEDNELIERYFRSELSSDERSEFERKLATDDSFKALFEVEAVIYKSIQYSTELERVKSLKEVKVREPKTSLEWLKSYNLLYAGGAALVIWLASNIVYGVFHVDAELVKWVGLSLSFILSVVSILIIDRKISLKSFTTSAINCLMIFVISSGIDAINQGVDSNSKEVKAVLIPYTQATVWWPTRSLVDSVVQQKKVNQGLSLQNTKLKTIINSVRDSCFNSKFDRILPIAVPKSSTIVAGMTYEADVFAAAPYLLDEAEIEVDGKPISMELDSNTGIRVGRIKFKASGMNFDSSGISKASYQVSLNIPGSSPLNRTVEYEVIRPVAEFESEGLITLYLDCGNEIKVSVPGLPNPSAISLSVPADQGKVIQEGPGKFVLIPIRPSVDVQVSVDGIQIGVKQFKAKPVPTPIAKLLVDNREYYDEKRGIPPGTSIVRLIPDISDETFKRQNPKDADYRVVSMTLQITGKTPITLNSGTIDINKYGLRAGDSFSVFNVQVIRSTWDPSDAGNKPVSAKLEGVYVMGR